MAQTPLCDRQAMRCRSGMREAATAGAAGASFREGGWNPVEHPGAIPWG
ncbi:hypothetical protein [Methylobacillus methanolivorans]